MSISGITLIIPVSAGVICLFVGFINGLTAGAFIVNSITQMAGPAYLTGVGLVVIASVCFSLGVGGLSGLALVGVSLLCLIAGGWLGFTVGNDQLDPNVSVRAAEVWQGAGVAGIAPFIPGWFHNRVAGLLLIGGGGGVAFFGVGCLIRYLLIRAVLRSMPASGSLPDADTDHQ